MGNSSDITISDDIDYIKVYPKVSNGIFLKQNNDTVWVNNPIVLSVYKEGNDLKYRHVEADRPKKLTLRNI